MEDNLTPKQHKAIESLLLAPTLKQAAEQAGCAERTLRVWLKDPAFAAEYRDARRVALGHAMAQLQQHASAAVKELANLMSGFGGTKPDIRLAAAKTLLELAFRAGELSDLDGRLAALEEAQHAKQ